MKTITFLRFFERGTYRDENRLFCKWKLCLIVQWNLVLSQNYGYFGFLFVFYFSKLNNYQTLQVKRKAKLRRWLIYWERRPQQSCLLFKFYYSTQLFFKPHPWKFFPIWISGNTIFFPLYDKKFLSLLQNEKKKYSPPIFYSFVTESYSSHCINHYMHTRNFYQIYNLPHLESKHLWSFQTKNTY